MGLAREHVYHPYRSYMDIGGHLLAEYIGNRKASTSRFSHQRLRYLEPFQALVNEIVACPRSGGASLAIC
jgi:hypothetical protein